MFSINARTRQLLGKDLGDTVQVRVRSREAG